MLYSVCVVWCVFGQTEARHTHRTHTDTVGNDESFCDGRGEVMQT